MSLAGITKAKKILDGDSGARSNLFYQLNLASVKSSKNSAEDFKRREDKLNIIVANAVISMVSLAELLEDGVTRSCLLRIISVILHPLVAC